MAPPPGSPRPLLVAAALAIVYLVWGSTYLAIRVAVHDIPPFLLAGARFLAAGVILAVFARARGAPAPDARAWGAASLAGLVTFVASHGALAWASQYVPSGMAALLQSASPAWIALAGMAGFVAGHRTTLGGALGVVLGLAGVVLVADPGQLLGGGSAGAVASLVLVAGSLAWAGGGLLARWSLLPKDAFLAAGMSMGLGGVMLLLLSGGLGEWGRFQPEHVSAAAWASLAYLTVVGSVVAYAAYVWVLRADGPGRVSAHAFVNPIVAVVLGAALLGEPLTARVLGGIALVAGGVALLHAPPWAVLGSRLRRGVAARPVPCQGCPS